ncbi:MAG: ABC transporter substrate-binding protein, partial [Aristaeellaceae bacterium]
MKKLTSVLLALVMLLTLMTGAMAAEETYTYRGIYSSVSTWSPTDWSISSEYDMLGYTVSEFYGFWMNESKDGYDIVCELAAEFPVDVTAAYAGNATYGVPADATEGYAWQVKMRQDACWQDGTPITAHDVGYTLQQFLSPDMKNYRASLFYAGGIALANAEAYYNSDKVGGVKLSQAANIGKTMAEFA